MGRSRERLRQSPWDGPLSAPTLPLLILLTAGTAFSVWLAQNTILVGMISTIAFIGGLAAILESSLGAGFNPQGYALYRELTLLLAEG